MLALTSFLLSACGSKENANGIVSVAISQPSAELVIGETLLLKATVSPSNATFDGLSWTSTKPKVASVSESGLVSALSEGNTTITVMTGGKTASCSVSVVRSSVPVYSISLNKSLLEMVEGNSETLSASVFPEDATDKTVTWTSSKEGVATVKNGVVSAISAGEATITAKAGNKTATCKVVVAKKSIPVESITLNKESLTINKGESEMLEATVKPDDATNRTVTWSSSDDSIVRVTQRGTIGAVKGGEATITATADGKTATCKVFVFVPVWGVTISPSSITLAESQSTYLTATVSPQDATDKTVVWTSGRPDIVSVDDDGRLTALKKGQATIYASSGKYSASCKVVVIGEEELDFEHTVIVKASPIYSTRQSNGHTTYVFTYTISNNSPVDIDVYNVTIATPEYQLFFYPGIIKAGSSSDFYLYNTIKAGPKATVYFRCGDKEYQVSGGLYN